MNEEKTPNLPKYETLSDTTVNCEDNDSFLIDIGKLVFTAEGLEELAKEDREEVSKERKAVREADNIYTVKHFIRDNLKLVKKDRKLQEEIKKKTTRLKSITKEGETEYAAILMTELLINDMLEEDIGE